MSTPKDSSAAAETAALRIRQRQIGRELRIFFERHTLDLLPEDMVEAVRKVGERPEPDLGPPDK